MSKVYTRGGDKGTTCIFGRGRVSKADPLIDVIGYLDELQVNIGMLIALMDDGERKEEINYLKSTQLRIFEMNAILAAPNKDRVFEDFSGDMEKRIDFLTKDLEPLREFILAGSNVAEAQAHLCRVVCRKVERKIWIWSPDSNHYTNIKKYVNRFSDYFFTLARFLASEETRYKISKQKTTVVSKE